MIKLYRKDYDRIVNTPAEAATIKDMIEEHENWEKNKKKKRKPGKKVCGKK